MVNNQYEKRGESLAENKYELRNQVPCLKSDYPFLTTVYSSPTKNTAFRLYNAFQKFFAGENDHPKFRSWKKKWFSLYYDEPGKGYKLLDDRTLKIALGADKNNKRMYVYGKLQESLNLRDKDQIKTFRLCKQQGDRFYAIFTVERIPVEKEIDKEKWIAIDPNHKNFFVAVDYQGDTYTFEKLEILKYWDQVIDRIKSKRDLCQRKATLVTENKGKNYYLPSRRWSRLNDALNRAYHCRREQIKSASFSIANFIAREYDHVAIGDYTPSLDTAIYDRMHRSMLNQEIIGKFRKILEWIMIRSGKSCSIVEETNTTKECCICGDLKKKSPDIRSFVCQECKTALDRDINSAVNIAKKDTLLSGSDYEDWDLSQTSYTVRWDYQSSTISFTGCDTEKSVA